MLRHIELKRQDGRGQSFYTQDTPNGMAYPVRIDYTGNAGASLQPYNSVQFVYATRPDATALYHAGSLMKTTQRLTDVINLRRRQPRRRPGIGCTRYDKTGDAVTIFDAAGGQVRAKVVKIAPGNAEKLAP